MASPLLARPMVPGAATRRQGARFLVACGALVALALSLLPAWTPRTAAQSAPFCADLSEPVFISGFAELKSMLGAGMGAPTMCAALNADGSGDFYQITTMGIAVWRKGSGVYSFSNGFEHWARTDTGWVYWESETVADPPSDAVPLPTTVGLGRPSRARRGLPLAPTSPPASIAIPRLGLAETTVLPVGLDADGGMAAPFDPDTVGWYQYAPGVGGPGNAILAGHVDWGGRPRVFSSLSRLNPGDLVYVTAEDGARRAYSVQWSQLYVTEEAPLDMIFGQGEEQELTLITCAGFFDPNTAVYVNRLVVRASLLPDA